MEPQVKSRRDFLKTLGAGAGCLAFAQTLPAAEADTARPNIVLCMTDDQGWGDTAYNSHPHLKTPVLDEMAATGLRFDRFYAAAPVCSPTRGSVMTGRHPNRYGCFLWGFSIRPEEKTIAEVLKESGYATGHFGKWHLGPVNADSPVSPGACGFDEYLSHDNFFELDPELSRNGAPPKTFESESSEIIVDQALQFMRKTRQAGRPFFVVVWFGSPHTPHRALPNDKALYSDLPENMQNYLGEITAMDRAMGMLREGLRDMDVAEDTLLWFCSDNGATGPGSTGGLRGKKGSLWEGGLRVPGIIEWPARIKEPMATSAPACTSDIFPTIVDLLDISIDDPVTPIDGISLREWIDGRLTTRPRPIPFWQYEWEQETDNDWYIEEEKLQGWWRDFRNFKHPEPKTDNFAGHAALTDNRYKLHKVNGDLLLYDLVKDPKETTDIAADNPEVVTAMKTVLEDWQRSVEMSLAGRDY